MNSAFVIDQVSWHTSTPGNTETRNNIVQRFYIIINYLQDNDLVTHTMLNVRDDITDEFAIRSDDLTDEGLALMREAYDKWLRKVDQGMTPTDLSLMERALERVRKG